jgi:2-polyprenyl-6-methoxyphenol hydroxylase-like FAD-dependent oxidoreductase
MDYDLVIVGGGLAGSALAAAMAPTGTRVLIVERDAVFRDRVRGEGMLPWGVAEARQLGIYDRLLERCAHQTRFLTMPDSNRDLVATTPARAGMLDFHHPEMQQCLLDLATESGADLLRPAEVVDVTPGDPPSVTIRSEGSTRQLTSRLVIGADGRNSRVRAMCNFDVERDPDWVTVAGTLYRDMRMPDDAVQMVINPNDQRLSIVFPIGAGRFRAYAAYLAAAHPTLSGVRDADRFIEMSLTAGASPDWFRDAVCVGPLASFNAPDCWAPHPYRDDVVLIGDAAAASDPVWGSGLSLTLRDARVLRDHLLANADWRAAAAAYAREHDSYFAALHRTHGLWSRLFFGVGDDAAALRERSLPRIGEDPSRMIDFIGLGPEAPNDTAAERRFFSED